MDAKYLHDMGEAPSSIEYLLRLEFNGEAVTVQAPSRQWVSQEDEE